MKKSRRKARELALQGLYQWRVSGNAVEAILPQLVEAPEYASVDDGYLREVLEGAISKRDELERAIEPKLDRKIAELSPVEHSILLLAAFELVHKPDVPYRVVINEAVELAKRYGGTDGHKYVNGVLDKLAASLARTE